MGIPDSVVAYVDTGLQHLGWSHEVSGIAVDCFSPELIAWFEPKINGTDAEQAEADSRLRQMAGDKGWFFELLRSSSEDNLPPSAQQFLPILASRARDALWTALSRMKGIGSIKAHEVLSGLRDAELWSLDHDNRTQVAKRAQDLAQAYLSRTRETIVTDIRPALVEAMRLDLWQLLVNVYHVPADQAREMLLLIGDDEFYADAKSAMEGALMPVATRLAETHGIKV